MAIRRILRNFNLFIDGRGYAGEANMVTLPTLAVKTEAYRAGGMDAEVDIDMGMEKLEASLELSGIDRDLVRQWGLSEGNQIPLTVRGALRDDDGTTTPVVVNLRGQVKQLDWGDWKAGESVPIKAMISVRYYKYVDNGDTLIEIDVENMVRIVDGVDQLAEMRAALGI